jgi:hypothetical protein
MATYKRKEGFRLIRRREAQVIGEAFERIRSSLGRQNFSEEEFYRFCRRSSEPVHRTWRRVRDAFVQTAGRKASTYLMSSVEEVTVTYENAPPRTVEPVIVINRGNSGMAFTPAQIRRSRDLLAEKEHDFMSTVRSAAKEFTEVVAAGRMKRANSRVMREF